MVKRIEPRTFAFFAGDEIGIQMVKGWHYEIVMRGKSYVRVANDPTNPVNLDKIPEMKVLILERLRSHPGGITLIANYGFKINHKSRHVKFAKNQQLLAN